MKHSAVVRLILVFIAVSFTSFSSAFPEAGPEETENKADTDFVRQQFLKVTTNETYLASDIEDNSVVINWEAPEYFQRGFPFYMAGYDYEDRPLWVVEVGKYDFREALERGSETQENLEKWVMKMSHEFYKSRVEKGVEEIAIIFDFEGFSVRQFSHLPSMAFMIRTVRRLSNLAKAHLGNTVIVNASYLTRTFVDLVRPLWGTVFDNVEVFGTNKERWMAQMRSFFPPESLPPWYGGKGKSESYKPLRTFG